MPNTIRCLCVFALLILSIDSEPIRKGKRHQVVIVGAGVSGFTAAATLLEHNVTDLVVLEAADRIGGRIHTVEFGGVVIDRGAEFCHGEVDNVVYDLVGPHDLLTSYDALTTPEQCLIIKHNRA
ncbi:polyamine oxidase 1-like [Homalodisca vitripennis]|uniref:polyamine oxidase 1-like n=1 Tax=Homalodisca vitripennis TaxID=197043 RepID=UPI001EEB9D5A|nr:polyamine oxidase 1-like [Homalodisca vitripennis]